MQRTLDTTHTPAAEAEREYEAGMHPTQAHGCTSVDGLQQADCLNRTPSSILHDVTTRHPKTKRSVETAVKL